MLPFVSKYALEEDRPIYWENAWKQAGDASFVLESGKDGRYTFIGLSPVSTVRGKGKEAYIDHHMGTPEECVKGNSLAIIKLWMQPFRSPIVEGAPKFVGGSVGFLGYDVIRTIEKLPVLTNDDLGLPDYVMMRFNQVWIIDHQAKELYCAHHTPCFSDIGEEMLMSAYQTAEKAVIEMKKQWDMIVSINQEEWAVKRQSNQKRALLEQTELIDPEAMTGISRAFAKAEYIAAVQKIKQYISDGDVFQVNLSVRQSRKLESKPEDIYEWLRLVNPSPYMGMLRLPDFQLVSASPELLVQLEGKIVRTRPIAGTRPRGANEAEDLRLAEELIHNEKERAEHIMLVDLERNDLGKISQFGSVKVDEFMVIEYYSHVMHIVSEVHGELSPGKDAFDVITATFPGGTITGAPKIRTMEIIEELEPVRRGPYTGSIGWIDYNGNMELNIIIRTLVVSNGTGYIQAGAGIVIDSQPDKEYVESLNKAKALWNAIQYSDADKFIIK
jgi:para-aminobenzoate synthetase component 1